MCHAHSFVNMFQRRKFMKMLSGPHPVRGEDVFELSLASEGSGAFASPGGQREKQRSRTSSRSSGGKTGPILAAALAVLPSFIPEPAAADELFISGGGDGGDGAYVGDGTSKTPDAGNAYGNNCTPSHPQTGTRQAIRRIVGVFSVDRLFQSTPIITMKNTHR
jgi:hypothetical protein